MSEPEREAAPLDAKLADAMRLLPREREPGGLLEERTVRSLRERGVLNGGGRRIGRVWWAAGVAASLALFASGVATGQWIGTRTASEVMVAQQQATLEEASVLLERTGEAYVSALAQLAETNADRSENSPARAVALRVLHQAANEVVRLAPNDPVATKILQGFDRAAVQPTPGEPRERRRQIVWY